MNLSLYRISGVAQPHTLPPPPQLTLGLRRHLQHAPLHSVRLNSGERQRSYVQLWGCSGCAHGNCQPGCLVHAFGRTLRAAFGPTARLERVERGLNPRTYTRAIMARPTPQSFGLASALLPWSEARLEVTWFAGETPRCMLRLDTGSDGPDPLAWLQDRGWRAWVLPAPQRPLPLQWLGAAAKPMEPWLPLECQITRAAEQPQQAVAWDLSLYTNLAQRLRDAAAGRSSANLTPTAAIPQWPSGPIREQVRLSASEVAHLTEAILADPTITADPHEPGLLRSRLIPLLPERQRLLAGPIMLWWEQAGLLAEPSDANQPWRRARHLACTDLETIRQRLLATPPPDAEAQAAARQRGLR